MAVKTSLVVETFNPNTNKTKSSTATHANPNATNAQLNNFAQKMYGSAGLSANTVNAVVRVDKRDITNAERQITGTVTTNPTVINFEYRFTIPDEDFEVITNSDGAISFEFYDYDEPDVPIEDGTLEVNHKTGNTYTVHVLDVTNNASTRIVVKVAATELYTAAECYLDYIGND